MEKFLKKFLGGITEVKNLFHRGKRSMALLLIAAFQLLIGSVEMFAAADPFASATTEIKGYQTSVQNLLYAIAAIIALVGAFNVFHKMTNGDQDVKKTIMLTLGGCIAMVALSAALPAFFD